MADQLCGAKRIFRSVIPAFLLAVSVGQIYAFTNFSSEIANYIGEKQEHVQFAFSLGIFFLGMGAAFFGKISRRTSNYRPSSAPSCSFQDCWSPALASA